MKDENLSAIPEEMMVQLPLRARQND